MTDTIRELILRVLDYVEKMPGARFEIARYSKVVSKSVDCQYYFRYRVYDRLELHFVKRNGNELWSSCADLTEDNLRYLLSQLEGKNDSI